jgi:hypothetical protein
VQVADRVVGPVASAEPGASTLAGAVILPASIPEPSVMMMLALVAAGMGLRHAPRRLGRRALGSTARRTA